MNEELLTALRALADQIAPGPKTSRLEAVVDEDTNEALVAVAEYLGGRNARSEAARVLLRRGAKGMLDDFTAPAGRKRAGRS